MAGRFVAEAAAARSLGGDVGGEIPPSTMKVWAVT